MFRTAFFILSILSFSFVQADDLLSVYQQVLTGDPELKAAEAGHRANLLGKDKARALYLPNVNLSADTTAVTQDNSISGTTDFTSNGYNVSLSQPVFRYDAIVQQKQADISIERSVSELSAIQQQVMLKASERYFNFLSAETSLEFARSEKTAIAKQLEQAKKRFEVGLIAITDVHEAQAAYDLAIASEITAINLRASAIEALTEITGSTHENLARLGTDMPLHKPDPDSMEEWTDIAIQQNLQLKAVMLATQIAKEDIRLKRTGHYPTLDIVASHDYSDNSRILTGGPTGEVTDDRIALQLKIPLYKGGLTTAQIKESAQLYNQSQENLEQQRRSVLRQTRDAYRGVINGISQVQALNQATISTKSALETTQAGFDVGTRTIVDVLLAQRSLFGAKRDYDKARHEYILNILRLKLAAGTLSPADLSYFNDWLKK